MSYWESMKKKQVYYLHSSQPTVRNGFVPSTKPVATSQTNIMEVFQQFFKNSASFASNWIKPWLSEKKESPAHSPVGSRNSSASSHPPLADDSSDEDDMISEQITFQDIKPEFVRSPRETIFSTGYYRAPPTPSSSVRSRSGTPTVRSGTPRPLCQAICRNGQPCRNSAMSGSDNCHRHYFDSSFR